MLRLAVAAVLALLVAVPARADTPVPQLMGDRLRAGELQLLEQDLTSKLASAPKDDQIRFALGAARFIRVIERLSQNMYRYGLQPPREVANNLPFFRFPLPPNPKAETLDYEKMRDVFKEALAGFASVDAALAGMGDGEVKLPVSIGLAKLDLNGDGKLDEEERLWRVFNGSLAGGSLPPEAAERFTITFDRGDAAWLRGYSHLLSAMLEFMLAHDGKASFDASAHMLFPNAGLPNAILDRMQRTPDPYFDAAAISDAVAAIHLMHWEVKEPERLMSALSHLEAVAKLSRESWRFILAETDDEAEWIPSPRQKNGVMPGGTVPQQTVDGWMAFLDEFDAILQGHKLIPHWRLDKGINFRRVFTEPRPFDPVLWAQGSAALPYLEDGPMTDGLTWNRIMSLFEGNFLGYAVWFN